MRVRTPQQELTSFFNPAFVALNIYALAEGYVKNNDKGIPLPLIYIAIPLSIHARTRSLLPATAAKKFHAWIQENQEILIGFGQRAAAMKQRVDQGLMVAHSAGLTEITSASSIIPIKKPRGTKSVLNYGDLKECFVAANRIGQMLSKIPDQSFVYYLLGIRP